MYCSLLKNSCKKSVCLKYTPGDRMKCQTYSFSRVVVILGVEKLLNLSPAFPYLKHFKIFLIPEGISLAVSKQSSVLILQMNIRCFAAVVPIYNSVLLRIFLAMSSKCLKFETWHSSSTLKIGWITEKSCPKRLSNPYLARAGIHQYN